jgi:hypothetical protein
MSLAEELPVYKASYDLVLAIFNIAKSFKKEFKYTIGESLKNEAVTAVTNIYRANCTNDKTEYIKTARENIEVIRLYARLLKDLHQISIKQLVFLNGHIENVSKQLTGWHKSQKINQ